MDYRRSTVECKIDGQIYVDNDEAAEGDEFGREQALLQFAIRITDTTTVSFPLSQIRYNKSRFVKTRLLLAFSQHSTQEGFQAANQPAPERVCCKEQGYTPHKQDGDSHDGKLAPPTTSRLRSG